MYMHTTHTYAFVANSVSYTFSSYMHALYHGVLQLLIAFVLHMHQMTMSMIEEDKGVLSKVKATVRVKLKCDEYYIDENN